MNTEIPKRISYLGSNHMYSKLPNLVLGFHGCDQSVFEKVIMEGQPLKMSQNEYDWLGHGIYFWEQNYQRALEWAKKSPKIKDPAVIGAVIDLGYCLNLTDSASSEKLRKGYELLRVRCEAMGAALPENKPSKKVSDILLRNLDCAVIQQIHDYNRQNKSPAFDSIRGIFTEGNPAYPGACFMEKTHVQLCIVNPNCIKGYFNPRSPDEKYPIP